MKKHVIAAAILVLAALPVSAELSDVFTFEPHAVTVRVTPATTVAFIGQVGLRQPFAVKTDTDGDGSVRFDTGSREPYWRSLWCAVDLKSGAIHVASLGYWSPVPLAPLNANFLRDAEGNYSWVELHEEHPAVSIMWVRPGVGAWSTAYSNGYREERFHISRMHPYSGPRQSMPAGFRKGDILVLLRNGGEAPLIGGLVDERLDAAASEPSLISVQPPVQMFESMGAASIEFYRTGSSDRRASLRYTITDDAPADGVHYETTSGTITFAPGDVSKTVEVPIPDDEVWTGGSQFRLFVSAVSGATLRTRASQFVRIPDDDPKPVLTIGTVEKMEGGDGEHQITVPVTLTGATLVPATLDWVAIRRPNVIVRGRLVFPPGVTEQTIPIRYSGNTTPNADLVFDISASSVSNAVVKNGVAIAVDDDGLGITPADLTVSEGVGNAMVPLTLSAPSTMPIQVSYSVHSGTAEGRDLTFVRGTVIFEPGETLQYAPVPVIQEKVYENSEDFTIALSAASPGVDIRRSSATVTIDDDDGIPPIEVSAWPSQENHFSVVFEVGTDERAMERNLLLTARPVGGSAQENRDFRKEETTFNLRFRTWVDVRIINDQLPESPETLSLEIVDPLNPGVVLASGHGTIDDDESLPLPTLTVSEVTVTEGRDGAAAFEIALSGTSSEQVTFRADAVRGTALTGEDFELFHTSIIFEPGQTSTTIHVPILDDNENEAHETFSVQLSAVVNAKVSRFGGTARIIDNDASDAVDDPTVAVENIEVAESAGIVRFELRLSEAQTRRVSLEWKTLDGTARGAQDYEARDGKVRFEPGELLKTIEIPLVDDPDFEDDETFTLRLSSGDVRFANSEPVCTIVNDDAEPKGRRRSARH
jgi:hypothetical protein